MTNSEIIAAVERWQADPRLHPMTCCTSSRLHDPMKPIEKGGQVILQCPDCGYCQVSIPEAVLEWDGNVAWLLGIAR